MAEPDRVDRRLGLWILCGLIVAAMVGAALLYVWTSSYNTYQKQTPKVEMEMEERPDGYVVSVIKFSPFVSAASVDWFLFNKTGGIVDTGTLGEYLGLNFNYTDSDGNPQGLISVFGDLTSGKIRVGTQILITKKLLPENTEGWHFRLRFGPTKEILGKDLFLDKAMWNPAPLPSYPQVNIITTLQHDTNLSFVAGETLSRIPILVCTGIKFSFYIHNSGNQSFSNVTFELLTNLSEQALINEINLTIPTNTTVTLTYNLGNSRSNSIFLKNLPRIYLERSVSFIPRLISDENVTLLQGVFVVDLIENCTVYSPSFHLNLLFLVLAALVSVLTNARYSASSLRG